MFQQLVIMGNITEKLTLTLIALDYEGIPNLITDTNEPLKGHKDFVFNRTRKKLDIDATYFIQDTPVIYFKYFDKKDEQQISSLHQKAWNIGLTPLLFVALEDEIRIYSCFVAPTLKDGVISSDEALIASSKASDVKDIYADLKAFSRVEIDTGNFWGQYPKEFSNASRINTCLLEDLKELNIELQGTKLAFEYIHNLIARTVFVLYLENRGLLNTDFYSKYNKKFITFADVLTSKAKAFELFTDIGNHFGKDLLPPSDKEKKAVTLKHLTIIKDALLAGSNKSPDNNFWAYSFEAISVEHICSIFEEFLYLELKGKDVSSSTPPALAKMMLNEVLPYERSVSFSQILDPACGTSIFLVESFQRLIESWMLTHKTEPTFNDLFCLLEDCIFGYDYNPEALKFTAFCLFLAMIDYIKEINFDDPVNCDTIIGNNLATSDFFDQNSVLHKNKYDIIIGNPPWQSNYGDLAKDYLKKSGHPVGDKQISQLFLWQASDLVKPDGNICILMPSKGLLYNFNPKNMEFREKFFKSFNVKKIINLSLFSNLLFDNSKFPASIIVFKLENENNPSRGMTYYTPKPSNKCWEFSTLVTDPSNVKRLPKKQVLDNPTIWKTAFVGSGRDYLLVNHLDKNFPKIDYICEDREWKYGEGFQLGGGDKNVNDDMAKMLNIPAKSIFPFYVNKEDLEVLGKNTFHRPRDFDLYKAPHTIVRGGQIFAAYIDYDAVFTHAVMSFSSTNSDDGDLLKLLAAYLNSSLVLYYLFLTSSTWCIERTDIHLAEYRTLPFTIPSDKTVFSNILTTYDQLSKLVAEDTKNFQKNQEFVELKDKLDNHIFDMFDLDSDQRQLILDITKYSINYFQDYSKSSKSKSIPDCTRRPDSYILEEYAKLFSNKLNRHLSRHNYKIVTTIYLSDSPLEVMTFALAPKDTKQKDIKVINSNDEYLNIIKKLDNMVLKQTGDSLFTTKNLRIFEGSKFHLIKPSEIRFWAKSMALNDSDKSIKEILKGFGKK